MIRFNCPYCGNEFAVRDTYAGRDGWCRVCKELVLVPTEDGKGPHMDDLPAEERISRFRAKLKYAATQADTYKQIALRIWAEVDALLLAREDKDRKLTPDAVEESLSAWHSAWEARAGAASPPSSEAGALEKLEAELTRLRDTVDVKSRAFADANEEAERLRAAVAALEAERDSFAKQAAATPDADDGPTRGELDALNNNLQTARLALADLESKHAGRESALNELRAELSAAQSERDDAKRARRVLQDEVASLRVELDAALYANVSATADGKDTAEKARADVLEAQTREAALRDELSAARLKLADLEATKTGVESALHALREELDGAQAERTEALRVRGVLQDEVESLRVELDAALHAKSQQALDGGAEQSLDGDGHQSAVDGMVRQVTQRDGAVKLPSAPTWQNAPVVVAQPKRGAVEPAEEMELVEAEIEGLDPFENDAMMSSYLHFLSESRGRGK